MRITLFYKQEVDFIAAGLTITYDRSQIIGFTFQFDDDESALLIPYPELEILGNLDAIARPFQYEVCTVYLFIYNNCINSINSWGSFYTQIWIFIGISIVATATVLWKIISLEFMMLKSRRLATNTKKISLIFSFRSLFRFQYIRKFFLLYKKIYTWK